MGPGEPSKVMDGRAFPASWGRARRLAGHGTAAGQARLGHTPRQGRAHLRAFQTQLAAGEVGGRGHRRGQCPHLPPVDPVGAALKISGWKRQGRARRTET
ncbi:uncharacterized protein C16orf74 homolog isoform X1 [Hyaena hyaena]|uniref:uncharacterized protein C16orf74 homolog isoform X1 n=1 Tax=Hyaena hyaena TaxID=95912 RepID=UPI0019214E5D|nr:uncharacterized protein C16orf74 homolog isoform X1 [Hyaena hyaena]